MHGQKFRDWINSNFENYGRDPWFFLRELAQNSRDASAKEINVDAVRTKAGKEIITFEDDGTGMTFDHAKKYLFRFYSSSKTGNNLAAGMYGIGFWSVLKFDPDQVIIESNNGKNNWAVVINRDLTVHNAGSQLDSTGTKITLLRSCRFTSETAFQEEVQKALIKYNRFLRRNDKGSNRLPLFFLSQDLTSELELPQTVLNRKFRRGAIQGVIGLAEKPSVTVYSKGLFVWEGTVLEELLPNYREKQDNNKSFFGLGPKFIINGDNLKINLSRQGVMDNKSLRRLFSIARDELNKMVNFYSDQAYPRGLFLRVFDMLRKTTRDLKRSFWKKLILLIMIIIPLEIYLLTGLSPKSGQVPQNNDGTLLTQGFNYSGPTPSPKISGLKTRLSYYPPVDMMFKLFTADYYSVKDGFARVPGILAEQPAVVPHPDEEKLWVDLKLNEKGQHFLPIPQGYALDPGSLKAISSDKITVSFMSNGEIIITSPEANLDINYTCIKILPEMSDPGVPDILKYKQLPSEVSLKAIGNNDLQIIKNADIREKLSWALDLTKKLTLYDNSLSVAAKYDQIKNSQSWLEKVIKIGRGDCDIINGLTVLLLRKADVQARLVIGFLGQGGETNPILHSWTEYLDQGWQIIDSTLHVSSVGGENDFEDSNSQKSNNNNRFNNFILILGFFFFFFILIALVAKVKRKPDKSDLPLIKKTLAKMATGALLQPRVWAFGHSIWNYRIIPTLGNKNISMRHALYLARQNKLFIRSKPVRGIDPSSINQDNVLDSCHPIFQSVIRLLPGAIDLDLIRELRIGNDKFFSPDLEPFLSIYRESFAKNRSSYIPILPAPGLKENNFIDIDLSGLVKKGSGELPSRFIAVKPDSLFLSDNLILFKTNPQLAIYRVLKDLIVRSNLFTAKSKSRILLKVSLLLLERY